MLPETSELAAFLAIVDAGSLSRAAEELGLPRTTLTRRLARLEERLGARLLHRTTRRLRLTHEGEEFYQHARAAVKATEDAARAVRRDDEEPRGLLRLSIPPVAGPSGGMRAVLDFIDAYPNVQVEVIASTQHEDMVERNIDLALRAGAEFDPGLIVRTLLRTDVLALAAPAYLERAGVPSAVADLAHHRCLVGFARGERPAAHWPLVDGGMVRVRASLATNDVWLLSAAVARGMGIALLPQPIAAKLLKRGEAVPEVLGTRTQVALVYPSRRLIKPAVRAFIDFFAERFRMDFDAHFEDRFSP
ncbi:MAG: LysR family transcriptional regulator [Myxococcota bacterium]